MINAHPDGRILDERIVATLAEAGDISTLRSGKSGEEKRGEDRGRTWDAGVAFRESVGASLGSDERVTGGVDVMRTSRQPDSVCYKEIWLVSLLHFEAKERADL